MPQASDNFCGNDVALLILNRNVPASEGTPIVPRLDLPTFAGERYTAVGYGHTGAGNDSGTRRYKEGRQTLCGGKRPCSSSQTNFSEFVGTEGTCQGDSGGAPIDSEGRVFGALSRGPGTCGQGTYAGIHEWRDWIRETALRAAQLGGYGPLPWMDAGPIVDRDLDGLNNDVDNCPEDANVDQADADGDGLGDVCDADADGDGTEDLRQDNCPGVPNPDQADFDLDGEGDACDEDDDSDLVKDARDNCPLVPNERQLDRDTDGVGDACDPDADGDGIDDTEDNCPEDANAGQADGDGDGAGDACDTTPTPPVVVQPPAVPTGGDGFNPPTFEPLSGGTTAEASDDGGCSSAPAGVPASPLAPLALFGLLGLGRLRRRLRR